jgi:hypothetical protein
MSHATADPFSSNLKVSEAACVDAEVWMHGYGCVMADYDPFSSNLKSVRLHVCMGCWKCGCMGMDAPHATADPFSSNLKVSECMCV